MRRREFLIGAGVASIGGFAGCSGLVDPDLEFQRFIVSDPKMVSVDSAENEYFATIQNGGGAGYIRVELWYYENGRVPSQTDPAMYYTDNHAGRHFDSLIDQYFDADERREVSITGSSNPPIQSETYEYGMFPWPASYGAAFKNTGSSGTVEFRFEYRDTGEYEPEEPPTQLESVGSDELIEVSFDTVVPPRVEYEIVAEQA